MNQAINLSPDEMRKVLEDVPQLLRLGYEDAPREADVRVSAERAMREFDPGAAAGST